ncbi:signal recognition particle receptor subunit alpha [Wolbachia endosymbiont of Diaphorina citri]|uniref:signal recognition particle receptor subunit alpha n=1 Tax=Wolbachia endosymbiont of Diaphorina citri TaxID=116598 RepID=UPI0022401A06
MSANLLQNLTNSLTSLYFNDVTKLKEVLGYKLSEFRFSFFSLSNEYSTNFIMFKSLTESLNSVFNKLRGKSIISEDDFNLAMREIRMALIEADVSP